MSLTVFSDEFFMKEALKQAQLALEANEVPVGAVITCNNQIVARAHNLTETLVDVTAHAEMQAFTSATDFIGGKYLKDCTLFVTLEPCVMCAGASLLDTNWQNRFWCIMIQNVDTLQLAIQLFIPEQQ